MLETAIIGGGLCGLALARSLARQGRFAAVFEARQRLGGRILTQHAASGLPLDLGPAWFWPGNQPLISGLLAELGFESLPQHDDGTVLHMREADAKVDRIAGRFVHGDARRVAEGLGALISALAGALPDGRLYLGHALTAVADAGDHVRLTFSTDSGPRTMTARTVVLALPPRLVAERIRFTPALEPHVMEALEGTATWMAAQAKVAIAYDSAAWREAGFSGNAFVTHEQAVVGEIYDACGPGGSPAALGGFLALAPELRQAFAAGLPMLMDNQMLQLFGSAVEGGVQAYQDWAREPFTCSTRDLAAPAPEHVDHGPPLLRRPFWEGRLHFGGSETAARGAGYLEGALEAAHRIERTLPRPATQGETLAVDVDPNAACLARFTAWVAGRNDAALDAYRRHLTRDLSTQQRDQLTQRALLAAVEGVFSEALDELAALPFVMDDVAVERGRSALTPLVQKPFGVFLQTLLDDAIAFNRTSCALSNFTTEHKPDKDYVQAMLRDVAAAWQDFSRAVNRVLLAKAAGGATPAAETAASGARVIPLQH